MDFKASARDLLESLLLDTTAEPKGLPLLLLESITNNFSDDQVIGRGGFSVVYQGRLLNGTIAVKRLSQEPNMDEKNFNNELISLIRVKHKNIARFLGYCAHTQGKVEQYQGHMVVADIRQRLLCFEYLPNGGLDKHINDKSCKNRWRTYFQIIKGICEGLHYLHQKNIVHGDLKPANILLDYDMVPKIADFGRSRCFDKEQTREITTNVVGTWGYMAPEFFNSGVITLKSDIYSLGIVIIELLTGQKEYLQIDNVIDCWRTRFQTSLESTSENNARVIADIGLKCIDSDSTKRPKMQQIIEILDKLEHTSPLSSACITRASGQTSDKIMFGNLVEVVHTIGDEVSFTRFIEDLRRILAEHPDRENIFDVRPLLAKQHAEQPARWLHVKLLVVEGKETSSATLLMRDDNLYVCGFINQNGILCKLIDNEDSESFLPGGFRTSTVQLGVSYNSLLKAKNRDDVVRKLTAAQLGSGFAKDAVRVLSSHPNKVAGINMSTEVALAGLIFIVCESARMSSVHKSIESGWSGGEGFTKQLMEDYVWKYAEMSCRLQAWKSRDYTEPHRVSELGATHLVLNTWLSDLSIASGRPLVELLSIRADIRAVGTKIIVFDGKRGQIIYRHKEQGEEQGMVDLVLTGPYTGISPAYGCFSIKIDTPAAAVGSSSGYDGGPIKWEWDCYDPKYSTQVNASEALHQDMTAPDGRKVAEVTYAVMSDAQQAKLQVILRLNDGQRPGGVSGKITAHSSIFDDGIVLFSRTQGMGQYFSPTIDDSWFLLELPRNVVAVPYGKRPRIKVDLQIETSNNQGIKHLKAEVCLDSGIPSRTQVVYGGQVEVNATWYPEVKRESEFGKHELVCTIDDDEMSYIGFIMSVRRILANHPNRKDILDKHHDSNLSSTRLHPLLAIYDLNDFDSPMRRLLYIKLQVRDEIKPSSTTTLVIGFEDALLRGFLNEHGEYFSEGRWGSYTIVPSDQDRTLRVDNTWEEVWRKLDSDGLGKTSAVNAVRVLSGFRSSDNLEEVNKARLAVVSLMVMICDSARLNPVFDAIAIGWNSGTRLTQPLMDYIKNWDHISTALLHWKDSGYRRWIQDKGLERIGINNHDDALRINHLCWAGPVRMTRGVVGSA